MSYFEEQRHEIELSRAKWEKETEEQDRKHAEQSAEAARRLERTHHENDDRIRRAGSGESLPPREPADP